MTVTGDGLPWLQGLTLVAPVAVAVCGYERRMAARPGCAVLGCTSVCLLTAACPLPAVSPHPQLYGRDWARLAEAIPSKSTSQIKTFYHNYKTKLGLDKMELPPTAAQPSGRKGGGGRARDSVPRDPSGLLARGDEGLDDERPAKRQAMVRKAVLVCILPYSTTMIANFSPSWR